MAEVLYGQAEIGSNSTGFAQKKVYLADVDFKPQGVVVTGLQDPSRSPTTVDTFAFQVTALQEGLFNSTSCESTPRAVGDRSCGSAISRGSGGLTR